MPSHYKKLPGYEMRRSALRAGTRGLLRMPCDLQSDHDRQQRIKFRIPLESLAPQECKQEWVQRVIDIDQIS